MLLRKSGRQGSLKFIVTMIAAAIGVAILLAVFSITHAILATNTHATWREALYNNTSAAPDKGHMLAPGAVINLPPDALVQTFLDKQIFSFRMSSTGGVLPKGSPLDKYPSVGEYYVSPALDKLLRDYPGSVLADRFPGRQVGIIPDRSLVSPDELVIISGIDLSLFDDPSSTSLLNATRVVDFTAQTDEAYNARMTIILNSFMAIGAAGLIVPVMILVATATNLGGREREARYAALRLVGSTKAQLRKVMLVDSLAASAVGIVIGSVLFYLLKPLISSLQMYANMRFFSNDISVEPWVFAVIIVTIATLVWIMNSIASRRSVISPLGVARKQKKLKRPRAWRVIPLALCLGAAAYVNTLDKKSLTKLFDNTLPLYLVGLFFLTMISLFVAGGWLVRSYGRLTGFWSRRASGVLVAKRIDYEAYRIFQGIAGVVIAFFAGTFFITSLGTLTAYMNAKVSLLDKAAPDGSIVLIAGSDNTSLAVLQSVITKSGVYQQNPVIIHSSPVAMSGASEAGDQFIACTDVVRLFNTSCEKPGNYLAIPQSQTSSAIDMTRTVAALPVANEGEVETPEQRVYLPLSGVNVVIEAEKVITAYQNRETCTNCSSSNLYLVNSALRAATTSNAIRGIKDLLYAGIIVTIAVASINLIVATLAGIFDRKSSFFTLRLAGAGRTFLRRIVLRESMIPLVAMSLVSVASGLFIAYVFLRQTSTLLRNAFVFPEPLFWGCLVAVWVISYIGIRLLLPLLDTITDIKNNQHE